jgi:hypothetical protein
MPPSATVLALPYRHHAGHCGSRLAARQARRVNSCELALDTRVTGGSGESTPGVMTMQLMPSLLGQRADATISKLVQVIEASVAKVPAILRGLAQSMDDALGIQSVRIEPSGAGALS